MGDAVMETEWRKSTWEVLTRHKRDEESWQNYMYFFLVANEERNLQCYPKLGKWREREVFGTMKCLPWRSQLINGCGAQEEFCFCGNPVSLFLTQYQLSVSCFSVRSAHTGNDTTGNKHLQSIWCLFDDLHYSQRKYKSKKETFLVPHTCSCPSSCDFG